MEQTLSTTEASRRTVQRFLDTGLAGDVAGLAAFLDDRFVLHEPSFLPYAGDHHGWDGFMQAFAQIAERLDVQRAEVDRLVADGDRVVAFMRIPDLRTGQHTCIAEESRVQDGKIIEIRVFIHDAQSLIG
jgi:ketosteroid isomerase-like protein